MGIHVLPPEVASQIAAGEVVERPSSVVKELVENSIDAGARDVRVEVRRGGKIFIRVTDDGCGIPAAEVELAFHRHATSKLASADDLQRIATLGFRGEALASIAAVSRVTMVTRAAGEEVGTLIRLEGGRVIDRRSSGRPPGTTVTVEDLFFNVPARRKFLRSDLTERRHIDAWLTRYALAYPHLRFTVVHDGRETFRSPGNGRVREVLVAVFGPEVGSALLEIPEEAGVDGRIRVSGFVSPPSIHRANRGHITLFVNGRWVQDARLTYAVIQAYHTLLPTGRYPVAVVQIDLPPEEVDVNVHPAKVEVRFRDADGVFRAVQRAVRRAVVGGAPVPSVSPPTPARWAERDRSTVAHRLVEVPRAEPAAVPLQPSLEPSVRPGGLPPLRVIGQVGGTYIVAEGPDGLYLIDQHAAHERVLYEEMMARREEGVPSQRLLEPAMVEVGPEVAPLVEARLETLARLGLEVEPFGGNHFLVRSLPAVLAHARPAEVLLEVAEALGEARSPVEQEVEEAIVRGICKRAAVKAGQVLTREEMEALIRSLERCTSPRTCPHGRPTMIRITAEQLAREFGRGNAG
ncbi:MAG TPA: DNA mismatch repair endonuclease MutL [Thermoflexia bacterium]|nr:DNA mismatch repair endonuclease MutL [Thermoflexia bacterium]